jgi:hypothetical protein
MPKEGVRCIPGNADATLAMKNNPKDRISRKPAIILAGIIAAGALVRIFAARGDLWLDEIWSINLAQEASSMLGVITEIHHDNNNYLNTMFIRLLGPASWLYAYRIPAVVCGIFTIVLAFWLGRKRSLTEGLTALVLTASSYLLVQYSSEARGYASMLLFALLAFWTLEAFFETKRRWLALLFAVWAVLGFLSHLSFIHAYMALAAWSCWRLFPRGSRWLAYLVDLVICHALPVIALGLIFLVDVRYVRVGGGESLGFGVSYFRAMALTMGINTDPDAARFWGSCGIIVICLALFLMWRDKCKQWVPLSIGFFLGPILLQILTPFHAAYERHFLVGVIFGLLALAHLMSRLWQAAPWGKVAYGVLLAGFLAANGWHVARLLQLGRGDYLGTLNYIAQTTRGEKITIGSDQDFRSRTMVNFYQPFIKRELSYYNQGEWPKQGPEWFLKQERTGGATPPRFLIDPYGHKYELVRQAFYAGYSGWSWFVFHKID